MSTYTRKSTTVESVKIDSSDEKSGAVRRKTRSMTPSKSGTEINIQEIQGRHRKKKSKQVRYSANEA
jgi:hypothetical protein